MELTEVMDRCRGFIRSQFEVAETDAEFGDDVHLFDYGYVDSFGAVKIIRFVKSEFGVEITDRDLVVESLNTVREIASLVHRRLSKESSQ